MTNRWPHITVCICTYKRPALLKRLLSELTRQQTGGRFTYSVVVADNDAGRSAEAVLAEFRDGSALTAEYCVQPERNIALTRNKALAQARGDYVAFIDDDEFPDVDWLSKLLAAADLYEAAGVLGPVRPFFEEPPPSWLIQGKFCERPELPTGSRLQWRQTRTGNVLFSKRILDGLEAPFDPAFGNGGEDQDFFRRMIERGDTFVWCNEAVVHEVVPPSRWTRAYLLRRALLRGQNERSFLTFGSLAKSIVAVPAYTLALPFLLLAGQHHFMNYLVKLMDHAGKLMGSLGLRPLGNKYVSS